MVHFSGKSRSRIASASPTVIESLFANSLASIFGLNGRMYSFTYPTLPAWSGLFLAVSRSSDQRGSLLKSALLMLIFLPDLLYFSFRNGLESDSSFLVLSSLSCFVKAASQPQFPANPTETLALH